MAQHDYSIANQSGAAFRADLNNALAAAVSQNSGSAAPSTTYAYQFWADTTTGLLKVRNAANTAWITVGTLANANLGLAPLTGATFTGAVTLPAGSVVSGYLPTAGGTMTGGLVVPSINGGPLGGNRNRIINGDMSIDVRNSGGAVTVTANAVTYVVDRWFAYSVGSSVTAQQVSITATAGTRTALRLTGAAGNTTATLGHRLETTNINDLAGQSVTVSFWAATSVNRTMTFNVLSANATNTWGSSTNVYTTTFNTTSTYAYYSITFTIPSGSVNGITFDFSLTTGMTSGTFDLFNVQLEAGSTVHLQRPSENKKIRIEYGNRRRLTSTSAQAHKPRRVC
jgi:hypothetical protein